MVPLIKGILIGYHDIVFDSAKQTKMEIISFFDE